MRNKGTTLLVEIILAILFFSLSAVIMVQLFAAGHQQAAQSRAASQALSLAQDWAERAAASDMLPPAYLLSAGFQETGSHMLSLSASGGMEITYEYALERSPAGTLCTGGLSVCGEGGPLAALPLSRYLPGEEAAYE